MNWLLTLILAIGFPIFSESAPVVVELFESQGCSSCPPSEKVMNTLADEFGSSVILITHHVDYWDYLGWKDTFSHPPSTQRQNEFGVAFNQRSIYTPEMVVQGEVGFVGSDLRQARGEIKRRLRVERPEFSAKLHGSKGAQQLLIKIPPGSFSSLKRMTVVFTRDLPPVQVLRGENAGVTMSGDHAVLGMISASTPSSTRATIPLPASWQGGSVVVLLEDPSLRILASQSLKTL